MKDELNIRELYNDIIREAAAINGNIIMEEVKIPATRASPDKLHFDGETYDFDFNTRPFCFIGKDSKLIGYVDDEGGTHPYIFNAFALLTAALGLAEAPPMLSDAVEGYRGAKLSNAKKILGSLDVKFLGKMDAENLKYFMDKQKSGMTTDTRRNTRAGRIWRTIQSKTLNKETPVIVFWCKEKLVSEEDLKSLKANFQLGDFFWSGTDSSNFNFYGDAYREIGGKETKELRSKIFPELSHEDIVDILMRAHSGHKMSKRDLKVVWEFRGYDPSELFHITGGYDMPAQYHYHKQMSESVGS